MANVERNPLRARDTWRRRDRALKAVGTGCRAILRATDEKSLLKVVCRTLVETAGYRIVWAGLVDTADVSSQLLPVAQWGYPTESIPILLQQESISSGANEPVERALDSRQPSVIQELRADAPSMIFRDDALKHDYASVVILPLVQESNVLGVLAIHAPEPEAFGAEETGLLMELANDLALGITLLRLRSAQEEAARRLLESEERFRLIAENARDVICILSDEGRFLYVSPSCEHVIGYPLKHMMQEMSFSDIVHPDDLPSLGDWRHLPLARFRARRADGALIWLEGSSHSVELEGHACVVAIFRDITERVQSSETIRRMAYFDPLTALPNRIELHQRVEEAIAEAKQQPSSLALLHLEIGRFREINETLGYEEGDRLLKEIAARICEVVWQAGTVARTGENEFSILLPKGGADNAEHWAKKILTALDKPVELSGLQLDTRAAIGIALFPGHGTNADALIRRARLALGQASREGHGIALYTGAADDEITRRLSLMGDLRRAIEQNELLLYCQPKVHIASRQVLGSEALVRWRHPQLGQINPGEFIHLAENAGLITPLTYWVLETALRQSYTWREVNYMRPFSINLSARDLRDPKLLDRIRGSLATWGAQPDWIQFELTETALMADPEGALEILHKIRDLGVELSIDDFGTGYSSLSYLQKLPLDTIKIDRSFVSDITVNEDSATIVRSTIELGHNLNLTVVAEGAEDQETWALLAELGCDVVQGFCVSEPMPAENLRDWEALSPWGKAAA